MLIRFLNLLDSDKLYIPKKRIMSLMSSPISLEENTRPTRLLLLGLLSSVFAVNVIDVFAPLLYPEIAATFGITVGTAVQLSAFSSAAGVITGLALSAFSIKFRYKTLLMAGVFAIVICVLGVFLAPNFLFAQLFYALNGVGSVIVGVMAPTLIGELYPLEKKATRVSWLAATGVLAVLIGNPVTGIIASAGGVASWRSAILWFMLPATSVSLLLVAFLVPRKPLLNPVDIRKEPFLNGYKEIFTNRSARGCLTNTFFGGIYIAVSILAPSFLSEKFAISPLLRSYVAICSTSLLVTGVLIAGFLVNKAGRKRLMWASAIPAVVFSVCGYPLSIFIPNIWVILVFRFAASFIGAFTIIAGSNLYLEQVPKFRGTMMSLQSAINGFGATVGVLIGGSLLNIFGDSILRYPVTMVTLGALGLVGTLNIILFAKDPVKTPQNAKQVQFTLGKDVNL